MSTVTPITTPDRNPGIVPPWLGNPRPKNPGIVPPWLQHPVHILPVEMPPMAAGETQFVPAETNSPTLVDALRAR